MGRGSRDGAVLEDIVLRPVSKVVQVQVKWGRVVTLEHIVALLLKPKVRRLCAIGAVPRPRRQFPFCAATVRSGCVVNRVIVMMRE